MDAHSKVDCGNLGNIVVFLNGKFSLEKRIQFSKNIFFSSSNVPPQHKEEVVVIWLIDILSTNKVLTLSSEEVKLVWKTLRELLSSRRLKALCTQHWVCPLTAPFIQTLITAACGSDDGTSRDVQEEALLICYTLIQVPSLSPQVALLTKQTLKIFTSLLSLTCEGYRPPSLVSQLSLLLQKSSFILKYEFKKHNSLCVIYEKLSLPLLEVLFVFKDDREDEAATKLVSAIETFLFSTILSKEEGHLYLSILDFPLQRESVESLSTFGESVFAFLRSLINKEDKCKASYFLREFCGCFFQVFRTVDVVPYQFIVIVMNLLGVSLEEGPRVQKNNLSSRSLLPIQLLSRLDRDRFIAAVLESLLSNNIELSLTVSDVTLKTWLENLGEHLVTKRDVNVNTLSCLKIIICADPLSKSKSRFLPHLLVVDRTNTKITELLDEILCEILNIHVKLRTVDLFYTDLCETLLTKSTSISLLTKQHDLTYYQDSQFLLPHNFFAKFLLSIKEMGSQMWMKTWHSIHKVISESCLESLKNESSSSESVNSRIAYTVWLSSCCLGASSVTKTAALSGLPSKVARLMNSLAHEGIIPLVNEMMQLTTEASSSMLCCSLLRVILVWGELHSTLMSVSSEYRNHTDFPFELSNDCTVPKNLSLVIPFIEPSCWKKIFSLLNDREDCERALIIQVMIQKLSVLKIQRSEIQILKNDSIDSSIMNILNYVLEIKDPSIYPITTDIIAMHLPSFLPHMKKFHFDVVSRCLVFGISERRESWIQFVSSSFFKGSELLQSRCFNLICEKLLAILSAGRKRKLDDDEEAAAAAQHHPLSQKLLSSLLTLQQEGSKSLVELEKDMTSLLVSVETLLMARNETCKFLTTREEGHVTTMLQIVDSFPISFLRPKLLLSVLAFTIIITVEEGGFMGRKAITVLLLRILNKVFVASNSHSIFKLSKRKPYSTLLWLERECQVVLKAVSVEECHLRVITTQRDKRLSNSDDDTLQALLVAMSRFTNSFVIWDKNGDKIKNYLDEIVNIVSLEESKDAGYLTAAILVHTLRENLPSCLSMSPDLTKGLEAFSSWCWKIVEEMDLSKITKVPIAWALITFSFLLQANLWLNKNRHTSDIDSSNAQSKIKQRVEANFIEWKILGKNGLQLAEIAAETEDASLRTLALEFYINVLASTKLIKNNEWGMSERIWSLMFLLDDSSTYMKDFVSALSPTQFKTVKKVLLEETQFGKMESPRFLKWLSVFSSSSSCNTSQTFFEQLTGILCIRFGSPNTTAAQASCYHSLYLLFISILQSEKNSLSHHHRSLILGMISQCSFTHLPYDDYFKTFQTATKLLNILLSSDHPFLPNRPSSFLSAIMALIAYLLDKTDLDDKEAVLLESQLREVEKCCAQIEMIIKNLKSNDRSFFKISSFTLASVLEKMHRTKMLPSVKMSMERIVFSLLDLSDPYSLRHLLVTLPPSVTTVLKHYHSTFNATFKYDPRIS